MQSTEVWGLGMPCTGYTVLDVGVQGLGVQSIWMQDLGCQKGLSHPDTIQGLPEAPMEKDADSCQDGAKTVPSTGLGTEGTETQVRAGEQARGGTRPVVAIPKG